MLLNNRKFKYLKNYRNVFLKVDKALSKLMTLLISNKK